MVRLTPTHIVYDIYETRSSLNAAVKGAAINWKDTTHNPDTGEFTTTYSAAGGFPPVVSAPVAQASLPFNPAEPCPTCGRASVENSPAPHVVESVHTDE
jgi:hypothetical protein